MLLSFLQYCLLSIAAAFAAHAMHQWHGMAGHGMASIGNTASPTSGVMKMKHLFILPGASLWASVQSFFDDCRGQFQLQPGLTRPPRCPNRL